MYCLAPDGCRGRLPALGGVAASLVAQPQTDVSVLPAFSAAFLCRFGGGGFARRAVGLNMVAEEKMERFERRIVPFFLSSDDVVETKEGAAHD